MFEKQARDRTKRMLENLAAGSIISREIEPRVGFDTAFQVAALVKGPKQVELSTYLNQLSNVQSYTEATLYEKTKTGTLFEKEFIIRPFLNIGDAILAIQLIRERMNSNVSFEVAINDYK